VEPANERQILIRMAARGQSACANIVRFLLPAVELAACSSKALPTTQRRRALVRSRAVRRLMCTGFIF
jgi:hypothetical protein